MEASTFFLYFAAALALLTVVAWTVRRAVQLLLPAGSSQALREAPLAVWFGLLTITLYLGAALFAPLLAPFPESAILGDELLPWGEAVDGGIAILGTDNLGRDMLSRMLYAARNTLGIAFVTTILAFLLGGLAGLTAAALGGWVDMALSRLVDAMMAVPQIIFALLLLTIFGADVLQMVLIIAVLDSTRVYRLARASAMSVAAMEYYEAAALRGEGLWWRITREILPNVSAPLIAEFGLRFCFVFLMVAALSFLGLGVQPPTADWGSMVRDTATLISFGDVTPLLPASAIALLTVAVNFVVDWMLRLSSGLKE